MKDNKKKFGSDFIEISILSGPLTTRKGGGDSDPFGTNRLKNPLNVLKTLVKFLSLLVSEE